MKAILSLAIASLLFVPIASVGSTVEYQHPNLTIVAKEESLDSVLKALGKEMRIFVTTPSGFNPLVNCDIEQQPIKLAIKKLLSDMSYSLEWEEKTGRLVGLTILAVGEGVASTSGRPTHTQSVEQASSTPVATTGSQTAGTPVAAGDHAPQIAADDTVITDHESRMETERAAHEVRMKTEREEHEARMSEERAAQEERIVEELARHEAEMAAYLESQGLNSPQ
jgi:hypothetical protein